MGRNRSLFVERLLAEAVATSFPHPIHTLYLGGGTPSQLSSADLNKLFDGLSRIFDLTQLRECTLEANPEDLTPQYVASLPSLINRISMGVQSFVNEELHLLRRRHNAMRPAEAINLLREHGINNISIDLMYGLPLQTLKSFAYSIEHALALGTQHISAYCLSVEEGTPLSRMVQNGQLTPADDDLCNEMNQLLRNKLQTAGFVQYEISNYAIPGFESKHNSSYWDGTPYLGLGPGAHSYDGDKIRWWNEPDLDAYLAGQNIQDHETLTVDDCYNERIMLSLRTRKGLDTRLLAQDFPSQFQSAFQPALASLQAEGMLRNDAGQLSLSDQGLAMADNIIRQLMI